MPKKDYAVRNYHQNYTNPHTLCNHTGRVLKGVLVNRFRFVLGNIRRSKKGKAIS